MNPLRLPALRFVLLPLRSFKGSALDRARLRSLLHGAGRLRAPGSLPKPDISIWLIIGHFNLVLTVPYKLWVWFIFLKMQKAGTELGQSVSAARGD